MTQPIIRDFRASDRDFVEATWLLNFRKCFYKLTPDSLYFERQKPLVAGILARAETRILLAVTPDYDDAILGYVVVERGAMLHYAYVKDAFRRMGIASTLLEASGLSRNEAFGYSHVTKLGSKFVKSFNRQAVFDPWSAWRRGDGEGRL